MDEAALRELLEDVRTGRVHADTAVTRLRRLPFAELGFAAVDHHRALRQGMVEAVYAPGKQSEHCAAIVQELLSVPGGPVLLTRAEQHQIDAALSVAPDGEQHHNLIVWRQAPRRAEHVAVLTAGTADLPVANECAATLGALGFAAQLIVDVGVAGMHRLLARLDDIADADAVVVVAGMEGALASVVGGIVAAPVVAVPTSVGYGAALEGVTALLAMLSSCASGVTVVGIDNGFGAACAVHRMLGPAVPAPVSERSHG